MEPERNMTANNNLAVDDTALATPPPASVHFFSTVDAFMKLSPRQRFAELIAGPNFPEYLRAEPITFDGRDQTYGYLCDIPDCELLVVCPVFS